MLTTTPWRTALEHGQSPMVARGLHGNEQANMEEHDLRQRVATAAAEYRLATGEDHPRPKQDTWFYPVVPRSTMGFYDVVLGWNHALVLEPVGRQLYAVQWILAYAADNYHEVHGGIGVDVQEAGSLDGWTVYRPRQKPMLRRVTTYNATTCSVSVVFPADGEGRLMISHIDASPPIPWGIALSWCSRAEERSLRLAPSGLNGARLRAITSICPDRVEQAKFRDQVCLAGGTLDLSPPFIPRLGPRLAQVWSGAPTIPRIVITPPPPTRTISTVALSRGVIPRDGVAVCEFNTQAGLVFERDRVPRFRVFLGNPPMLYIGLVPLTVQQELAGLTGHHPTLQELQRTLNDKLQKLRDLDGALLVYNRDAKRSVLVTEHADAQRVERELSQSLDATATFILQPLLDGTHGMRRLHRAVYQAFQGTPFQRACAMYRAINGPMSIDGVTVQREITRYFRVVDIPVTAAVHQQLVDNA